MLDSISKRSSPSSPSALLIIGSLSRLSPESLCVPLLVLLPNVSPLADSLTLGPLISSLPLLRVPFDVRVVSPLSLHYVCQNGIARGGTDELEEEVRVMKDKIESK